MNQIGQLINKDMYFNFGYLFNKLYGIMPVIHFYFNPLNQNCLHFTDASKWLNKWNSATGHGLQILDSLAIASDVSVPTMKNMFIRPNLARMFIPQKGFIACLVFRTNSGQEGINPSCEEENSFFPFNHSRSFPGCHVHSRMCRESIQRQIATE